MSKEIFRAFPINTVVEWVDDTQRQSLSTGWVTGYALNSVGEVVVVIALIQADSMRATSYVNPYNRMTRLTAVISGDCICGS